MWLGVLFVVLWCQRMVGIGGVGAVGFSILERGGFEDGE